MSTAPTAVNSILIDTLCSMFRAPIDDVDDDIDDAREEITELDPECEHVRQPLSLACKIMMRNEAYLELRSFQLLYDVMRSVLHTIEAARIYAKTYPSDDTVASWLHEQTEDMLLDILIQRSKDSRDEKRPLDERVDAEYELGYADRLLAVVANTPGYADHHAKQIHRRRVKVKQAILTHLL